MYVPTSVKTPADPWVPGSLIRRVSDLMALIPHSGILDMRSPNGQVAVIHNCKGEGVIRTGIDGFAAPGQRLELLQPQSREHQNSVLQRAHEALQGGAGYSATDQNCEHFANWAYYGIASSGTKDQILATVVVGGSLAALFALAKPDKSPPRRKAPTKKAAAKKPRKHASKSRATKRER